MLFEYVAFRKGGGQLVNFSLSLFFDHCCLICHCQFPVCSFVCFKCEKHNSDSCITFQPHVDFGLKVLGADLMSIPGLYRFVQVRCPLYFFTLFSVCSAFPSIGN